MNIFYLDTDPVKAAQAHIDRHVVKMTLEYAQILSTVHSIHGSTPQTAYRPTHVSHPSVRWASASKHNYQYVVDLWKGVSTEYTLRYGKIHKASFVYHADLLVPPPRLSWPVLTVPMSKEYQAVGDFKNDNPVVAYRSYYQATKQLDKNGVAMAKWTNRDKPDWF